MSLPQSDTCSLAASLPSWPLVYLAADNIGFKGQPFFLSGTGSRHCRLSISVQFEHPLIILKRERPTDFRTELKLTVV